MLSQCYELKYLLNATTAQPKRATTAQPKCATTAQLKRATTAQQIFLKKEKKIDIHVYIKSSKCINELY
jgi:hypothetical protein